MSDLAIQVNPKASLQVLNVGLEKTPVIVIDDFAVDISGVIEHACSNVDYGPDSTSAYPGIRGGLPRSYVLSLIHI